MSIKPTPKDEAVKRLKECIARDRELRVLDAADLAAGLTSALEAVPQSA